MTIHCQYSENCTLKLVNFIVFKLISIKLIFKKFSDLSAFSQEMVNLFFFQELIYTMLRRQEFPDSRICFSLLQRHLKEDTV